MGATLLWVKKKYRVNENILFCQNVTFTAEGVAFFFVFHSLNECYFLVFDIIFFFILCLSMA